jgi:la-related protein 1
MKGAMAPAGIPSMPMPGMVPSMPYSVQGSPYAAMPGAMMASPYQMPGIYTLPTYYVMPQMGASSSPPFLPGGGMPPQGGPPMAAPNLDRSTVVAQARLQIEHYFSIENLLKDMFLRKNMNEEGWVDISLIAKWPEMQKKTQDMSVLIEAISTSSMVEISPNGSHLRVRHDWAKWLVPQSQTSAPPMQAPGAAAIRPPV